MGEPEEMRELMNVTILLCKNCDEQVSYIDKIFDSIKLEGDRASFTIVTIVQYTKKRFSLHYFIINMEKEKQMYIGYAEFEELNNKEEDMDDQNVRKKSTVQRSSQKISITHLDDMEFISGGPHEILVYRYEDEEVDQAIKTVEDEKYFDLMRDEKLVANYGLWVEK